MENELITINSQLIEEAKSKILFCERAIKDLQADEKALRSALLEEMEKKGILKINCEDLSITYKEESYKETFDSKKFKQDHEDMYNDYVKISPVKASLLIKVK